MSDRDRSLPAPPPRMRRAPRRLNVMMMRALLLGAGFWALAEGAADALVAGVVVVAAATATSVLISAPARVSPSPLGLVLLALVFLRDSLRGGLDVAVRALSPRLPLSPTWIHFVTRLPPGAARRVFTSVISLMPGTLSVSTDGQQIVVHVLVDRGEVTKRSLARLETTIARALRPTSGSDASHA